ncbi:MAG: hypothetical protein V8T45_11805 [Oscillospiraceae bacterium]
MKKTQLISGIIYTLLGLALLLTAIFTNTEIGMLYGLGGALTGPGLVMMGKYFYWSRPQNRQRYEERLDNERIEMNDELKQKLRDRSGRYAYVLGMVTVSLSIFVIGILEDLGLIGDSRPMILYLAAYLIFQVIAGIAIFNRLLKKY